MLTILGIALMLYYGLNVRTPAWQVIPFVAVASGFFAWLSVTNRQKGRAALGEHMSASQVNEAILATAGMTFAIWILAMLIGVAIHRFRNRKRDQDSN